MSQDFEIKKLIDICFIKPPKKESTTLLDENDLVSFVPMKNLGINQKYINLEEERELKKVYSGYTYFKDNDVLLAKITPCFENGKLGIAKNLKNGIGFGSSEYIVYRPRDIEELKSEYLYYFLSQDIFREIGTPIMTGAVGHKRIPKEFYEEYMIPVFSIKEQKQIVEILDTAFEALEKIKKNIETNLKNTKELFDSKLNEIFSQKGEGWEEKTLDEVCNKIFAGGDKPKDSYSKEKTPEYNIPIFANAVKDKGLNGYTNLARVNEPSITISARGSGTGHTELRLVDFFPIVRLLVLIPNVKTVNLLFLKYSIDNLDILRSGSAIPQLTVPMIKEYLINLPSIEKQNIIVKNIDNLKEQTKQLEQKYQEKLDNIEELKKSLLEKAFSGELTK